MKEKKQSVKKETMQSTQAYYSSGGLRKLQEIELGILRDFDALCRENHLNYFMIGGSGIGVLRHGGFIPWDDDIDVAMLRPDYDAFLRIAEEQYADRYDLLNNDHNPLFPLMNTRWGAKGTTYKTEDMVDIPGNFGIFLDIFCFDNVPDDDRLMKRHIRKAWILGKLMVLRGVREPTLYIYGWKEKLLRIGLRLGHDVLKALRIDTRKLYQKAHALCIQYQDVETKRVAWMFDPYLYRIVYARDVFLPPKQAAFEDLTVSIPHDLDFYLTQQFGNYMQLPPEDKRHTHPPCMLDFGDF